MWLFLAVPWGCLRFVIVVFPDHTHFLFLTDKINSVMLKPLLSLNSKPQAGNEIEKHVFKFLMFLPTNNYIYVSDTELKLKIKHVFYKDISWVWGRIEKSAPRITVCHHEACRVMTNGDPKGRIFQSYPHTKN